MASQCKKSLSAVIFPLFNRFPFSILEPKLTIICFRIIGEDRLLLKSRLGEYILEAAREGCKMDWFRISEEIGLTQAMYQSIQNAVAKVGKEKLKPIKNELPEEVTYAQIKTCLTIQDLGLSSDDIFPSNHQDSCKKDDNVLEGTEASEITKENPHNLEYENDFDDCWRVMDEDNLPESNLQGTSTEAMDFSENQRKRQKVNARDVENGIAVVKATESSIIDLLEKSASGARLSDLMEHLNGSTEESVLELLTNLEGEFLIFRKNDVYMLM